MGRHARGHVVIESPAGAPSARDRRRTHARRKRRRAATPVAAVLVAAGLGVVGQPVVSAAKPHPNPKHNALPTKSAWRTSSYAPTPTTTTPAELATETPAPAPSPVEFTPTAEQLTAIAEPAADAEDAGREAEGDASLLPECTHLVSMSGSDGGPGTLAQPWRTVGASLSKLAAGDTLCIAEGTFSEEIVLTPPKGTPAARITVRAANTAARPLLDGRFALLDPDYWTISHLRFTNPTPEDDTKQLVSILAGTGWAFEHNEVFDAPYAGLLVGRSTEKGAPAEHVIRENEIHDTGAANLYYNPSRDGTGGVIERNVFFNSGTENVKLGWGGDDSCTGSNVSEFGVGQVIFRYNTLRHAQRGALIVAEPGGIGDVQVYRNLFADQPEHLVRYDSVDGCLGQRVYVHDNAGVQAERFSEDFGDSPVNKSHEAQNLFEANLDPRLDADLQPGETQLQHYGRWA